MNKIGLKNEYTDKMAEKLNVYLSNVQIAYMNARGLHWNITGKQFFSLHEKFEGVYDRLSDMADEIAERILMLGGSPLHSFSDYIKVASIKEKLNISSTEGSVQAFLEDTEYLLGAEREILAEASDNNDEGTVNLMSGYIEEQEKTIWMFNAFLK